MGLQSLSRVQWQSSLRTAFAALIATAVALRWGGGGDLDLWYCLYGVARSNLADQQLSARVAQERVLGTLFGGVIGSGLLLLGSGWPLVAVAYGLVELLGRRNGLSAGCRSNANVAAVLLFMVPAYGAIGPQYVFHRALWHLLGLLIGMAVEHLFWSRGARQRLEAVEAELMDQLRAIELQPAALEPVEQERRLVASMRQLRELAESVAGQDPTGWSAGMGEERLINLEQAVIHAAALVREPPSLRSRGTLEDRCLALDRLALGQHLARVDVQG